MSEQRSDTDDVRRIIVLIYGMFENSAPFWVFAAVKPGRYQSMLAAQKEGTIDLYHFENYGEIIVSGEGKSPPDEITLKVAEMYQTSPEVLLQTMKEE